MAKIMIVDDEAVFTETLCECLREEGHVVYTECDGLQALTRMLEVKPDVVVSDVMMPEMGGAPLLTAMRENATLGEIPVIIISGLPEQHLPPSCDGYAAFLQKPFEFDAMIDAVRRLAPPSA